jgi:hypothetical protein
MLPAPPVNSYCETSVVKPAMVALEWMNSAESTTSDGWQQDL